MKHKFVNWSHIVISASTDTYHLNTTFTGHDTKFSTCTIEFMNNNPVINGVERRSPTVSLGDLVELDGANYKVTHIHKDLGNHKTTISGEL